MENASKALIIAGAILISILLISIGIILINSGRDITETGTSGMQSQKIQTFNAQFTSYEGKKKGSELKDLASVVRASNASDSAHQVSLVSTFKNGGNTVLTSISSLIGSRDYNVSLTYSDGTQTSYTTTGNIVKPAKFATENGYIMEIKISD